LRQTARLRMAISFFCFYGFSGWEVVWEGEEESLLNFQPGVNCIFTQYRRRPPPSLDLIKRHSDKNPKARKVLNINSFLCKTMDILVGILTQQKALPKFVLVEPALYNLSCLGRTLNGTRSYLNSRHYENAYHSGLSWNMGQPLAHALRNGPSFLESSAPQALHMPQES
jgi:hypothetical protein